MSFSRLLKLFGAVLAVLGTVVLVLLAGLSLVTDEGWKRIVTAGITSVTGRDCAIEGDFDIGFLPAMTMRAGGFRLGNADWGERPFMLVTREVDLAIDTARLFAGTLDLRLAVDKPVIAIEHDADGTTNWDLAEQDDSGRTGLPLRPFLRDIRLKNATLILADARDPETTEIVFTEFRLGTEAKQLVVGIDGSDGDVRTRLSGTLGEADAILDGRPARIDLDGAFGANTLSLNGTLSGLSPWPVFEIDVLLQARSLADFDPFVAGTLPDLGPVKADLRVSGEDGRYAARTLRINVEDPRTRARMEGTIDDLAELQGIALRGRLDTDKLPEILAELDIKSPVPPPRMLAFNGRIIGSREQLALEDIDVRAEDVDVSATFSGHIADVISLDGVAGEIGVKAAGTAVLSRYTQTGLPELGAVDLTATVATDNKTIGARDLVLAISGQQMAGKLTGGVSDLRTFEGLDVTLDLEVKALAALSSLFGTELADTPPFTVHATFSAPAGIRGPAAIDGSIRSSGLSVAAKGDVANPAEFAGIDAAITIDSESVSVFNPLLGLALPAGVPLEADVRVVGKADHTVVDAAQVTIGETVIRADLQWKSADQARLDRPVITGSIDIDTLDLTEALAPKIELVEAQSAEVADDGSEEPFALKVGESDRLFSSAPFALEHLLAFDSDVRLTAQHLYTQDTSVDHLDAHVELRDGRLAIDPIRSRSDGSLIRGAVVIDAGEAPPRFSVDLKGEAVKLRRYTGTYDFEAQLTGEGQSVSELLGGLDGWIVVTAGGIVIAPEQLTDVERGVRNRLVVSSRPEATAEPVVDSTEIECLFARLDIADGIVDAKKKIVIQTHDTTWHLGGEIDLKSETINLVADSRSRRGLGLGLLSGVNLVNLILVSGPLSQPVFSLNPAGLAGQTAYYTAAAATGGLSMLLLGLFENAQANKDVCAQFFAKEGGSELPGGNVPGEDKAVQPGSSPHWEH